MSSFKLSILPEAVPAINCFQALDYLYVFGLLVPALSGGLSLLFSNQVFTDVFYFPQPNWTRTSAVGEPHAG